MLTRVQGQCNYMLCGSSEQGRECVAEITRELCKTLHVTQEFPQSFVHHSLGACERTYSTLAVYFKNIPASCSVCNELVCELFPLTYPIRDF